MCHHFNITFSYIPYVFFFFFVCVCFLVTKGRSQGTLASDKKLILDGSLALLELIFAEIPCSCGFKKHIK